MQDDLHRITADLEAYLRRTKGWDEAVASAVRAPPGGIVATWTAELEQLFVDFADPALTGTDSHTPIGAIVLGWSYQDSTASGAAYRGCRPYAGDVFVPRLEVELEGGLFGDVGGVDLGLLLDRMPEDCPTAMLDLAGAHAALLLGEAFDAASETAAFRALPLGAPVYLLLGRYDRFPFVVRCV